MKLGNFNFVRVWGEGSIPDRAFFEQCDRDGIVVWMEFMTAGGIRFPSMIPAIVANIRAEIADEIKRLRNHPSLAVWCGGNEHYLGFPSNDGDNTKPVGRELLQKIMPELVAQHDPQRYFHPSSPWGGENWPNGNHPLEGDFHDYNTVRFQPLSDVPLFMSEVCMIRPYSAHNMKRFISEREFWPEGFRFTLINRERSPGQRAGRNTRPAVPGRRWGGFRIFATSRMPKTPAGSLALPTESICAIYMNGYGGACPMASRTETGAPGARPSGG